MMKSLSHIFLALAFSFIGMTSGLAADSFSARIPLYASSSKLASGKWVKIYIKNNGIYKISFDKLKALGFSNPSKVRVFGYGGNLLSEALNENYSDDLPEVNSYLGDSYILFYGVGPEKWSYSIAKNTFDVTRNHYSDYGCYFLTELDGYRRTVASGAEVSDSATSVHRTHYDYDVYMPDKTNPYNGGYTWFDTPISVSGSKSISFSFPNMVAGNYSKASLKSYTSGSTSNDKNEITLSSGTSTSSTFSSSMNVDGFAQPSASKMSYTLDFSSSCSVANFYLQYLSATALCYNKLQNGYLAFNNVNDEGTSSVCDLVVSNVSSSTQVWNVTDPQNIVAVPTTLSGDSLSFKCQNTVLSSFVAFDPSSSAFMAIDSFSTASNQNLHAFSGADLIILTTEAYTSQAKRLGELHAQADGLSYYIVTPDQIYNEFSSGTVDPTAIRSFMKMLYDRAQDDDERVAPRYLLLFGAGCFDNRGRLSASSAKRNIILTYQTGTASSNYPADSYYGMLADNSVSFNIVNAYCQVGVGRLPFATASQADEVVTKIANYMKNDLYGDWKCKALILADDNENNATSASQYNEFLLKAEILADTISTYNPDVEIKKVYYDAFTRVSESSGYRYLDVENAITDNIADGTMFINYIGHSNSVNWSAEKTFTQNQVGSLSNKKLGIWLSASCEFSEYDNYSTSCGESLILAPNGGAIAVVATPRMVYASSNQLFDCAFSKYLFTQSEDDAIGDILRKSINQVRGNDIRMKFPLMGDPALRIVFPSTPYKVVTDSISLDTLKALSHVTVKGHIGSDSDVLSSFNGVVNVKVYDKQQKRTTKGNVNADWVATYKDYPTVLYSGQTEVVNGEFSYSFIVPNDIAYNYGNGRIACYAYDEADSIDATGSTSHFIVGGMLDSIPSDSVGPDVKIYINSSAFRSGDVVGANPVFMAEVADENGINSSGVGLGHDITISLNGGDKEILNEYFSYSANSSTSGKVTYQMAGLENGVYTLTFKVWDLLGNSSSRSITFTVDNGRSPHIDNVVAIPNPAVNSTTIRVSYDRPLTTVAYRVSIYDLQGRQVNHFTGTENSSNGQLDLTWDLKDRGGRKVEPGVYVYRVELKTDSSDYVGKSEKIVVLPQ